MNRQEKLRKGLANELEQPCSVCDLEDNCDCMVRGIVCPHQEKKSDQIIRYLKSEGAKFIGELPSIRGGKGEVMSALEYKKKLVIEELI